MQYVRQDLQGARTQAADAQAMVVGVKRDVEALRGELEQIKYQTGSESTTQELIRRLDALEARLAALEQGRQGFAEPGTTAMVTEPQAQVSPSTAVPAFEAAPVPAGAPAEYREGVELLRRGDGQAAIQKLREFLRKSPKSDLADDAQYWIGEAYYGLRDFNRAILEFNEVLLRYPRGDKVPAALLRQAYAFADLGDKVDARLVLQKLVSEHENTPEAEKGRQKLAELSS